MKVAVIFFVSLALIVAASVAWSTMLLRSG
jgi:hypothetical protein